MKIINKKIVEANQDGDSVKITCEDGTKFELYHEQDCCEAVTLEDSDGNIADSIGKMLYSIEEEHNADREPLSKNDESYTWTFYVVKTSLETITYRFYGTSNGYYSESVDLFVNGKRTEC